MASVALEIPSDIAAALERDAADEGVAAADRILQLLKEHYAPAPVGALPAAWVETWHREGVLGPFGGSLDAGDLARELRRKASRPRFQ